MKTTFLVTTVILAFVLHFIPTALASQPLTPREICEQALPHLMLGKAEGFETLAKFNTADESDKSLTELAAAYKEHAVGIQRWSEQKGRALGFELVEEKKVNDTFSRCVYVCKYERGFMRWVFTLYRPADRWFILSYHFDQNVDALFQ